MSYAPLLRPLDTSLLWKFQDIPYSQSGHVKHNLDVFLRPPERTAAARPLQPCVMFIHGGSWQRGSKRLTLNLYENVAAVACSAGGVGITIDYRLSPEVSFPSHLDDCAAALRWVQRNIARYGGDPDKVILCGHSAGAHLATLLAMRANTGCHSLGELSPAAVQRGRSPPAALRPVRGLIGISGVYNLLRIGNSPFGPALTEPAFGRDEAVLRAASPPYALMDIAAAHAASQGAAADPLSSIASLPVHPDSSVGHRQGDSGGNVGPTQGDCDISALASLPVLLLNASEDFHLASDAEELDMVLQLLRSQQLQHQPPDGGKGRGSSAASPAGETAAARASSLLDRVKAAAAGIQWAAPAAMGRLSNVARGVVPASNHVTIVGALGQPGDASSAAIHEFVQAVALA